MGIDDDIREEVATGDGLCEPLIAEDDALAGEAQAGEEMCGEGRCGEAVGGEARGGEAMADLGGDGSSRSGRDVM